ncbi:PadR family transcriptional regulator [Microbacterium sp. YY-01]|uniref:PadR family transcriptional regulator n=1 Tax=Microbacterium sp. YY-01 TaxID=3421634 RepID=UPI003D17B80E
MPDATLTPLSVMVLALLREGDMHPYEMMRLLRLRRDDRIVRITNGTFYHTVARLQRQGLIAEVGVDRDGNRPERTTYTLTATGPETLNEWVRQRLCRTDRRAEFRVALAEAHNLERHEVRALIVQRQNALEGELTSIRESLQEARSRNVAEQFIVEQVRHRMLLEAELHWSTHFLHQLDDPQCGWGREEITPAHAATAAAARKAAQA